MDLIWIVPLFRFFFFFFSSYFLNLPLTLRSRLFFSQITSRRDFVKIFGDLLLSLQEGSVVVFDNVNAMPLAPLLSATSRFTLYHIHTHTLIQFTSSPLLSFSQPVVFSSFLPIFLPVS